MSGIVRLAVHLETHLGDRPFVERWRAARALGFRACELNWRRHERAEAVAARAETALRVTCLGGTTGGRPGGPIPSLVWPEDRERLAADLEAALQAAEALDCPRLVMVPGNRVAGWDRARHRAEVVASLRAVAPRLEAAGRTAVIEPLNSRVDHRECWCDTSAEAFAVVEAVGSPAVKVLCDCYHMAVMGDDLVATIRRHHAAIGYYHVAGVPGRHEPLGGDVDFAPVFEAIAATGYDGYIGLEYTPALAPEESLARVRAAYPEPD